MHARRCIALRDDVRDFVTVLFGVQFLVFFFKAFGIVPAVVYAALVWLVFVHVRAPFVTVCYSIKRPPGGCQPMLFRVYFS